MYLCLCFMYLYLCICVFAFVFVFVARAGHTSSQGEQSQSPNLQSAPRQSGKMSTRLVANSGETTLNILSNTDGLVTKCHKGC